jgi:hypothetical protein
VDTDQRKKKTTHTTKIREKIPKRWVVWIPNP